LFVAHSILVSVHLSSLVSFFYLAVSAQFERILFLPSPFFCRFFPLFPFTSERESREQFFLSRYCEGYRVFFIHPFRAFPPFSSSSTWTSNCDIFSRFFFLSGEIQPILFNSMMTRFPSLSSFEGSSFFFFLYQVRSLTRAVLHFLLQSFLITDPFPPPMS